MEKKIYGIAIKKGSKITQEQKDKILKIKLCDGDLKNEINKKLNCPFEINSNGLYKSEFTSMKKTYDYSSLILMTRQEFKNGTGGIY